MAKRRFKRGICECTGTMGYWFRRRGKNEKKVKGHMRIRGECVSVLGQWATRLRKRGKKNEKNLGTCEGTGWATRLRKRGKKERRFKGDVWEYWVGH